MFSLLMSTFLLLIPGLMAAELTFFLKGTQSKRALDELSLIFIYSWIILFSNVLIKTLLGGGSEIFMITSTQFPTISLLKYLGLSMVFSVIYPNILIMFELMIKSRKTTDHVKP
jgi:hypothetical protein